MTSTLSVLLPIALVAVALILVLGLINMMRGKKPESIPDFDAMEGRPSIACHHHRDGKPVYFSVTIFLAICFSFCDQNDTRHLRTQTTNTFFAISDGIGTPVAVRVTQTIVMSWTISMIRAALISALMLTTTAGVALAADYSGSSSDYGNMGFLSELRMGVMAHDLTRREDGTVDLQGEVLFNTFGTLAEDASFWQRILTPRPHLGASFNTGSKTSYGYGGVTWLFPVYGPVFIEGSFGGMVHNGKLSNTDPNEEPLGTRVLFRETGSIGVDFERLRVMLTVEHSSNAGLGNWNHGLTNVGARVGYKF